MDKRAQEVDDAQRPMPQLLPWHETALEQIRAAWTAGRMPHALLIKGADGVGKRGLAAWLGGAVLCEASVSSATLQRCGHCAACRLVAANSHPDYTWVNPEEGKQLISVDHIREATSALTQTSYLRGYKVAVVEPAHQMTVQSANSLLKTLEEPTARTLLVLVTSQPSNLLPTIRSRCQTLLVRTPSATETLSWLQAQSDAAVEPQLVEFAGNAPLRALEFAAGRFAALNQLMHDTVGQLLAGKADVTRIAAEWNRKADQPDLPNRLTWLDLWLTSLARAAIGGTDDLITFPARPVPLPSAAPTLNISAVYGLVDRIRTLKAQLARTSLQRELAIESVLIDVLQVLGPAPAGR